MEMASARSPPASQAFHRAGIPHTQREREREPAHLWERAQVEREQRVVEDPLRVVERPEGGLRASADGGEELHVKVRLHPDVLRRRRRPDHVVDHLVVCRWCG